ncbi:MAG: transketolase, partial [Alphaproteobacteria bacterium]
PDRDRFVLSAGHGSMLLYGLLHLTGNPRVTLDEIRNFRQLGRLTAGHPEAGHPAGVETTTGPLGQGVATAVGMAIAETKLQAEFGADLVDHHTWVIASDGDLMEGISHEAGALAGHLGLGKLIVLWDDNGISIDGPTDLSMSDDVLKRFESYGWATATVDGHDAAAVEQALAAAKADTVRPTLIACKTTIGYGAPKKAGTSGSHGAPLGADEIAGTRAALDWPHAAFEIPEDIAARWRAAGARGAEKRKAWEARLAAAPADLRAEFERRMAGDLPAGFADAMAAYRKSVAEAKPTLATRAASQKALEAINAVLPETLGGSADLTGSNLTRTDALKPFGKADRAGRYVYWGVREHGMAAAGNGVALHGGLIPYTATFLIFTDYCRPAIRLAALMGQRQIFVMTHDSIGLGEDGPTHQPVEHLASLRAMPNLLVFRPSDALETAECWEIALEQKTRPSVIALSRQGAPALRGDAGENKSRRGAYVLAEADAPLRTVLIGTGTETALAVEAKALLEAKGIGARVVSMPCCELFAEQDRSERDSVLPPETLKAGIEAAAGFGWERHIGDGPFVGMSSFGASGPAGALYKHFGITADALAAAVAERLQA